MLLTEHHWEFLSLTEGSRGSSESTLVKMANSWNLMRGSIFDDEQIFHLPLHLGNNII